VHYSRRSLLRRASYRVPTVDRPPSRRLRGVELITKRANTMSGNTTANKQVASRLAEEVFSKGDLDAFDEIFSEAYVNHNIPVPKIPGTKAGPDRSFERLRVGPCPLLEPARGLSGDLLDCVQDRRVVEFAVGVQTEERVDQGCWRVRCHLDPRLFVGERLVPKRPGEHSRQGLDLVCRRERLGAAQRVSLALVPGLGQDHGGYGADVGGIDRRDLDIRPRGSHDVTAPQLGKPAQRV
jgi:hypothetical protein